MIIYETMPFLQRQLTVFKQDDAVVFVSLADDGRQEFLADYPTATIQAGHVPELDLFRRYAAGEPVDFRAIKIDYLRATPFQRAVWTALQLSQGDSGRGHGCREESADHYQCLSSDFTKAVWHRQICLRARYQTSFTIIRYTGKFALNRRFQHTSSSSAKKV